MEVLVASDAAQEPFYKQWWFLVIAALTGLILILVVVSLLCLTGRRNSRKAYKGQSLFLSINSARGIRLRRFSVLTQRHFFMLILLLI